MLKEQIKELLSILADKQEDCAPISLKIGYADEKQFIHRNQIVINNCAPSVVKLLLSEGYILDVREDGVHVDKYLSVGA